MIELFTIGFTQKSAENFFNILVNNNVKKIIDIRLSNSSQLSAFAKAEDLKYFAQKIAGIQYVYKPEYAPTEEIIKKYRSKEISWKEYETEYLKLLKKRKVSETFNADELHLGCLLCSEAAAEQCHRRLLAEYFRKLNDKIRITHL